MFKQKLKVVLLSFIPKEYIWALQDIFSPKTFGQLGEDAVIENHLEWLGLPANEQGVYLDIGAYHPTKGSNSYRFYRRNSHGYAIDIGKRKEKIWKALRPRDTFINAAVVPNSWEKDHIEFFMGNSYGQATDHVSGLGVGKDSAEGSTVKVKTLTANALSEFICKDPTWDKAPWRFISIDIEGLDDEFVRDLDLAKLAPDVLAVEYFLPSHIPVWDKMSFLVNSCDVIKDIQKKGFVLQSICGPTLIMVRTASRKW